MPDVEQPLPPRRTREQDTIRAMLGIFCRDHHGAASALCPACQALCDYAFARLQRCPFGEAKPTCARCPIHCYKPAMREQVRAVMAYAGPRMLLRHPLLAVRHRLDALRPVPKQESSNPRSEYRPPSKSDLAQ